MMMIDDGELMEKEVRPSHNDTSLTSKTVSLIFLDLFNVYRYQTSWIVVAKAQSISIVDKGDRKVDTVA